MFLMPWQPLRTWANRLILAGLLVGLVTQSTRLRWATQENAQLTQQVGIWQANAEAQHQATEGSRAYQRRLADLERRAAALRLRQPRCVPVASDTTARLNAAARDHGLPVPDAGVDRGALLDFARDCEDDALKLDALQDAVR